MITSEFLSSPSVCDTKLPFQIERCSFTALRQGREQSVCVFGGGCSGGGFWLRYPHFQTTDVLGTGNL